MVLLVAVWKWEDKKYVKDKFVPLIMLEGIQRPCLTLCGTAVEKENKHRHHYHEKLGFNCMRAPCGRSKNRDRRLTLYAHNAEHNLLTCYSFCSPKPLSYIPNPVESRVD